MVQNNRILTPDEFNTLVEAAHTDSLRQGFTSYLIGRTGMRRTEAAHFQPHWFDADNNRIVVPPEQDSWTPRTTYCVRVIPLSPPVAHNIEEYIDELDGEAFGISGSTVYHRVTSAGDIDGLPHVTPSLLRKMYGIKLSQAGIPMSVMSDILGLRNEQLGTKYHISRSVRDDRNQDAFADHWTSTEPDLFGSFPDEFQDRS